jgi:hypothetical protein
MKYYVLLPLFSHIARVPERGELRRKWFEWLNIREGCTFQNLSRNKCYDDQEPAEVELIALILSFAIV